MNMIDITSTTLIARFPHVPYNNLNFVDNPNFYDIDKIVTVLSIVNHMDCNDIEDLFNSPYEIPLTRLERNEITRSASQIINRRARQKNSEASINNEVQEASSRASEESTENNLDVTNVEKRTFPPSDEQLSSPCNSANQNGFDLEKELFTEFDSKKLPGIGKVFIKTWGCAHNNSDSEYMAGLLSEYGYDVFFEEEQAINSDVWLLNSCTVKNPSESHFATSIKRANELGKRIVIAGCVPQAWGLGESGKKSARALNADNLSIIGVQQIDRVVEVVEECLKGNTVRFLGIKKGNTNDSDNYSKINLIEKSIDISAPKKVKLGGAHLDLPKIRKNPLIEIVPISTGCLNRCSYCKTKHARGELASYPIDQILERIKHVVTNEGIMEIWLVSEDTGAYGRDISTNITELLWRILEILPEPVMLRMGMTNPPYILEHIDEIIKIYKHPRIYQYLHIPVQCGSNRILDLMKREYSRKDFEKIVDTLRKEIPSLNIATDLIVGFPGESEEDFEETWDLVQKYKFAVLFINQFYPRPGTPAFYMQKVPSNIIKNRTRKISNWFKNYRPYENRVGEVHDILVTEMAPDNIHMSGRTKYYEMVLVPFDQNYMGKVLNVTIIEAGKFYLKAEVNIKESYNNIYNQKKIETKFSSLKNNIKKEKLDFHEGDGDDEDSIDSTCKECSDTGICKSLEKGDFLKNAANNDVKNPEGLLSRNKSKIIARSSLDSSDDDNNSIITNMFTLIFGREWESSMINQISKMLNEFFSKNIFIHNYVFFGIVFSLLLIFYPYWKFYLL